MLRTLDSEALGKAASLPVKGFAVQHELTAGTLARALTDIAAGEKHIPRVLADYLIGLARLDKGPTRPRLTAREKEVLGLIVEGLGNREIGKRLRISVHGVKRHVSSLFTKLGVTTRTLAAVRAIDEGLVKRN